MKYQRFIFEDYSFDKATKQLKLHYSFDEKLNFTETYVFDFDYVDYDPQVLDRALQVLFFMAGVSYYKAYLAPVIEVKKGSIDQLLGQFLSSTYQRGLGEFFYVNHLDPNTSINFPVNTQVMVPLDSSKSNEGLLVGIGGGKDSLVSVELMRKKINNLSTWSVGHRPQLTPLIQRIGLPHFWVERQWDPALLKLNQEDALNGHIPISAILACVGLVVAILAGKRDIVVSNESSASEPTLNYQGVAINHQYSKSQTFERDFQKILKHLFNNQFSYYSFLRPLSEVRIAEIFSKIGFDKYKDVFSSCNQAFTHGSNQLFWDGKCPKCAFIFLALTPFIDKNQLENLFDGKNLLLTPELENTYRQLLGIEGHRPLDCVGEVKETRAAMRLAQKAYPQLKDLYQFDLPESYDYHALGPHLMPSEAFELFSDMLNAV